MEIIRSISTVLELKELLNTIPDGELENMPLVVMDNEGTIHELVEGVEILDMIEEGARITMCRLSGGGRIF